MPQHDMVLPHYMGRSTELSLKNNDSEQDHQRQTTDDFFSSLSPQEDIPLLMPPEIGGLPDSNVQTNSLCMNHNFFNQPMEIRSSVMDSFQAYNVEPLTQFEQTNGLLDEFGFLDEFGSFGHLREATIDTPPYMKTSNDWLETEHESNHVVAINEAKEIGPLTTINCQVSCLSMILFERQLRILCLRVKRPFFSCKPPQ